MSSAEKRITMILLIIFSTTCFFARIKKSKNEFSSLVITPQLRNQEPPEWISDSGRLRVFPNEKFISALGIGFSVDSAKAKAASGISSFIKTQVSSYTQFLYSEREKNSLISEEKKLNEEINLSSDETIYALDFTEPWHDEENSQYFCVAFIDKAEAWKQIEPKLLVIEADVENKLESAMEDKSGFWRTLILGKIVFEKEKFHSLYNYANLVNPYGAKVYSIIEEKFLEAESIIQNERSRQTVLLSVENDKNDVVYRALASVFEKFGFTVSQSRGKFVATAKIVLEIREEKTAFVAHPGITLEVKSALGVQVASFSHSVKKIVGFEKLALEEKAYRTLGMNVSDIILMTK